MYLQTPKEMAFSAARRFKALRKAKKITIKELSARSGVPYSTIRRFEASGEISFVSLIKIASVLNEDSSIEALFQSNAPLSIEEVIRGNY